MNRMEKAVSATPKKDKKKVVDYIQYEDLESAKTIGSLYNAFVRSEKKRLLDAWMYAQH